MALFLSGAPCQFGAPLLVTYESLVLSQYQGRRPKAVSVFWIMAGPAISPATTPQPLDNSNTPEKCCIKCFLVPRNKFLSKSCHGADCPSSNILFLIKPGYPS